MPKVPANLNLRPFMGAVLVRVEPLENIIYFTFQRPSGWRRLLKGPEIQVGVESEWNLFDPAGGLASSGSPMPKGSSSPAYPIGSRIAGSSVNAPRSFRLVFETGQALEVIDTSDQYESFCIPQEGVWI